MEKCHSSSLKKYVSLENSFLHFLDTYGIPKEVAVYRIVTILWYNVGKNGG
ncbi:hypothetical protein [Streptococcus halotolerans]|uniref:hypothetical protein n=1 Tax=Streptococcus halotolerans TaxID=1814128 RepID=UPI0012FD1575|nr:hypothetical protein [Streptococcus halotolerans]